MHLETANMNHETLTLTPALKTAWATNGITSRFFPDPDTCEETVKGLEDLVFIQVKVTPTQWKLTTCRRVTPQHPVGKKPNTKNQYQ